MPVSTPDAPDAAPKSTSAVAERSYAMLEERSVSEMLQAAVEQMQEAAASEVDIADLIAHFDGKIVFEPLPNVTARNADHAYRLAYKERFGEDGDGRMRLAAVSAKTWQPKTVSPRVRRNLTVG